MLSKPYYSKEIKCSSIHFKVKKIKFLEAGAFRVHLILVGIVFPQHIQKNW